MIYLDYNATTPVDPRVIECLAATLRDFPGNAGSRTHVYGDESRKVVDRARGEIATLAGVDPAEVIFTSGATESDNLAILGLAQYGERTGRKHVVSTPIEHKAVLNALHEMERRGFEVDYAPVGEDGRVDASSVLSMVRDDTLLVSVMHVNNETGVIQPVSEIGKGLALDHPEAFFHIDAAQSFGKIVDELRSLDFDLMSVTAHKMGGPQGVGALLLRRREYLLPPITPLHYGGGQEKAIRPGTLPTALIAAFGEAARIAGLEHEKDHEHAVGLKNAVIEVLESSGVQYEVNGASAHSVPTTLNVSFKGVSSEALMIAAKSSCAVSNGSACTSSSYEPSYVIRAMGLGNDRAESAIRISWGRGVEVQEARDAVSELCTAALRLQQ